MKKNILATCFRESLQGRNLLYSLMLIVLQLVIFAIVFGGFILFFTLLGVSVFKILGEISIQTPGVAASVMFFGVIFVFLLVVLFLLNILIKGFFQGVLTQYFLTKDFSLKPFSAGSLSSLVCSNSRNSVLDKPGSNKNSS